MGILLQPSWWQDFDATSPPAEWEAAPQSVAVTAAHPAATRFVVTTPLPDRCPVILGGTTIPTGFTRGTVYYVVALPSIDEFTFALTTVPGGAPIVGTTSGTAVTVTDERYYLGLGTPQPPFPDADVILLLHFDGANHATTFVDSSTYHETNSNMVYSAEISTVHPQFGTAAFSSVVGTGGARIIYNNAIDPLPSRYFIRDGKDFSIQAAVSKAAIDVAESGTIFSLGLAPTEYLVVGVAINTGHVYAICKTGDGLTQICNLDSGASICDGAYHQVSFERLGTTYYLYVDGVMVDSVTNAGTIGFDYRQVCMGLGLIAEGNSNPLAAAYLDEIRFINGYAVHQGADSYTPETEAFPDPGTDPQTASTTIQYIGNVTEPSLQSGMFGTLRLRYDVVALSSGSLNFFYDTGSGHVVTPLTNVIGANGIISVCLDGATQIDWGIETGATGAIVAFSEAPGDSTYGNVNFNCMCPEMPTFETLSELRNRMMLRLGFGAQKASPPPGMTDLLNEFIISAQTFLWKKYPATFTRRLFTWEMQPLQRFYGVLGNNDDPYRNLRMDFTKGIEWSGIYDQKNTWTPITEGIPPELYTMVTQAGRPQRYELRECIEVFPTPDVPYTLVLKGHIDLQPFSADDDTTTIDSEVVFLFALATGKAHYGQVDSVATGKMAMDYLGELTAGTHLNKRYIPGPRPLSPVVKPQMVQFQDGN